MREILFRGKRYDIGEWIEGGIYHNSEDEIVFIIKDTGLGYHEFIEVIPETVGQFTGLYDKNGNNKIFEGDIVRFKAYGRDYVCMVKFIEGNFSAVCKNASPFLDDVVKRNDATIIGNIHDNPELLKGETE